MPERPRIDSFVCYDPGAYLKTRLTVDDLGPGDPLSEGEHLVVEISIPERDMRHLSGQEIWGTWVEPALKDMAKAMNRIYDKVKFQAIGTSHGNDGIVQQVAREIPIRTSVWYDVASMMFRIAFDLKFIAHRRNTVFIVSRSGEGLIGVYSDRAIAEQVREQCFDPTEIIIEEKSIQTRP